MAKKFQLERPELAEELVGKQASAERARDHQRLMAVRLAMSGELTLAQIAKAVGKARSTVAAWMRMVRASGLEALLALHQGRGMRKLTINFVSESIPAQSQKSPRSLSFSIMRCPCSPTYCHCSSIAKRPTGKSRKLACM